MKNNNQTAKLAQLEQEKQVLADEVKKLHFFRKIVDELQCWIYFSNTDNKQTWVNKFALDRLDMSMEEATNCTYEELAEKLGVDSRSLAYCSQKNAEVLKTQKSIYNIEELPGMYADGKEVHAISNRTPIFNDETGVLEGVIGISFDTTDLVNARREKRRLEESIFAAMTAYTHDTTEWFESIHCSVVGALEVDKLDHYRSLYKSLLDLITPCKQARTQILKYASLSDSKVIRERVQLSDFLTECKEKYLPLIKDKQELIFRGAFDLSDIVYIDKVGLDVVTVNLLQNAIKFMQKGKIVLSLSCGCHQKEKGIFISVSDEGRGIAKEILSDIFQPFVGTEMTDGSVGLGLSLVQRVVQRNKGAVDVQSEELIGTTVRVFLPCVY